ncbi:MAG TPA: BTAD domain-containing putative transcriptional regulator [Micromonosporaceae bacterium]|nr:BTAD domain-containing putative transcriptional regulator [Micromonosporaceae bacterium]
MDVRILGPIELRRAGELLIPRRRLARVLLGVLALRPNITVPAGWLVDSLWQETVPRSAAANLRSYLTELRRLLTHADGDGPRIVSGRGRYALRISAESLDALRFEEYAREGRRRLSTGDLPAALNWLTRACGLWRGPLLDGMTVPDAVADAARRLEERHLEVLEDRIDTQLGLGRHAELVAELAGLTAVHGMRERLWRQRMLALYRCGRRAEALSAYQEVTRLVRSELDTVPDAQTRCLHRQILDRDPALDASATGQLTVMPSPAVPRQLPPDVTDFVDRVPQLALLDASGPGVWVVTGTAGVGKTGLVVHWGHRISERFPGGCLYADLRGYGPEPRVPPERVLRGFLRTLGADASRLSEDVVDLAATYRTLLAGRRTLVVLDNAATADQVRPLLPGGASTTLVTSRDELAGLVARDGARRMVLEPLSSSAALNLLRALVGERVDEEQDAAVLLAEQCARLPLTLRIAAERAVREPGSRLGDLTSELADRRRMLDALDAGGDPQTAARAVLSWSYRALPVEAARLFRLLGPHPGRDIDPTGAAVLAGTTPERAAGLLRALAHAHLIQPLGGGRYALHDLLRAYAWEPPD